MFWIHPAFDYHDAKHVMRQWMNEWSDTALVFDKVVFLLCSTEIIWVQDVFLVFFLKLFTTEDITGLSSVQYCCSTHLVHLKQLQSTTLPINLLLMLGSSITLHITGTNIPPLMCYSKSSCWRRVQVVYAAVYSRSVAWLTVHVLAVLEIRQKKKG